MLPADGLQGPPALRGEDRLVADVALVADRSARAAPWSRPPPRSGRARRSAASAASASQASIARTNSAFARPGPGRRASSTLPSVQSPSSMSFACDALKLSSTRASASSRSFSEAACAEQVAELITRTAWNLKPTGCGFTSRMPARKRPAIRSRYESPPFRCSMATSSAARGASPRSSARPARSPGGTGPPRGRPSVRRPCGRDHPQPGPVSQPRPQPDRRCRLQEPTPPQLTLHRGLLEVPSSSRARTQSPVSLGPARFATGESASPSPSECRRHRRFASRSARSSTAPDPM